MNRKEAEKLYKLCLVLGVEPDSDRDFDFQLGRSIDRVPDNLTLAVRHLATGGPVYGSLSCKRYINII